MPASLVASSSSTVDPGGGGKWPLSDTTRPPSRALSAPTICQETSFPVASLVRTNDLITGKAMLNCFVVVAPPA